MIQAFDHAEILTRDIAETRDFYVDKLGFELWRETKAVRPDGNSWSLACDMAATIADLESKGVEISRPPTQQTAYDGLRAEIKDPNGISIELREWQNGDSIDNFDWTPSDPATTVIS